MGEPGRIQGWWGRLSTGWRVNVVLYVLGTVSLFALLAEVMSGGTPSRRVEVAGESARRPTTTRALALPSSIPATTLQAGAPTSTGVPVVTSTPARPSPVTTRGASSPPAVGFNPAPQSPAPTLACRNGSDPRCGPFSWDPAPGPNEPLLIDVEVAPDGSQAKFTFTVSDRDHAVTANCAELDYGDGTTEPLPCTPAPCPPAFGPWTPPARAEGRQQFIYRHTYTRPGDYTVRFTFRNDKERCPDPYANSKSGSMAITVASGT